MEQDHHHAQVRVLRTTLVRPHLEEQRVMYLNNIDQRFGFFCRNVFFYEKSAHVSRGSVDVHDDIYSSLTKLLVPYYFAAGRFRRNQASGKMEILCANQGALLIAASVDMSVQEVKTGPIDAEQFLYFPNEAKTIEELPLLTVQVTKFSCGGFAIGILVQHAVTDATSAMYLMLNLSSISRTGEIVVAPDGDRTKLKPRSPPKPTHSHSELSAHPDLNSSRYSISLDTIKSQQVGHKKRRQLVHFSPNSLESLKAAIMSDQDEQQPVIKSCSTFEALAACVWRARAAASAGSDGRKPGSSKSRLRFFLDVRNIVQPSFGASFCGNAIYCVNAEATEEELLSKPLCFAVARIQDARKQITDEYVRSSWDFLELNPDHWYVDNCDVAINAWPRLMLGAMELDLGWGKPARVEFPLDPGSSTIVFFPVAKGGIDVSLCISDEQQDSWGI